ncbi:MAG: T9SS type A sorting domain-containing protein [Chitinophagaceae bacterium]|nr:T9SS type A sorting domain-containing protein [Chitinophagaceae bacterium]
MAPSTGNYKVEVTTPGGCSTTSAVKTVSKTCKEGSDVGLESDVEINLYPNPTNGNFVIEMDLGNEVNSEMDIQLLNILGQQVMLLHGSVVDGKLKQEIHLNAAVPSGIYNVRVIGADQIYNRQLIYQR